MAGFLVLCLLAGLAGIGVSGGYPQGWLRLLQLAPGRPPVWVFGLGWVLLYASQAVAAWMVWCVPDAALRNQQALTIWGWQIGIKALWTAVFFGLHWILPGLLIGAVLLVAVAYTMIRFATVSRAASLLLLPYFAWVGFEDYLNAGFWWLNR